eukprot:1385718-Amorphochlora_amoeboformis.AAC.1
MLNNLILTLTQGGTVPSPVRAMVRVELGLWLGSDYSACLSPRAIDSSTLISCYGGSDLSRVRFVVWDWVREG